MDNNSILMGFNWATWKLAEWTDDDGNIELSDDLRIDVKFSSNDSFTGHNICNKYAGGYTLEDSQLKISSKMSTTHAFCNNELDRKYLAALAGAQTYQVNAEGELQIAYQEEENISGILTFTADFTTFLGTKSDDLLTGTSQNNLLLGKNGNDSLLGNGGDDRIRGGKGEDTIAGGDQDDTLIGGRDNDQLDGGSGDDLLTGSLGEDTLIGGDGSDRFKFNSLSEGGDMILDFDSSQDIIAISNRGFGGGLNLDGLTESQLLIVDGTNSSSIGDEASFIYNTNNGSLSYTDTSNDIEITQVATLENIPELNFNNFLIVA